MNRRRHGKGRGWNSLLDTKHEVWFFFFFQELLYRIIAVKECLQNNRPISSTTDNWQDQHSVTYEECAKMAIGNLLCIPNSRPCWSLSITHSSSGASCGPKRLLQQQGIIGSQKKDDGATPDFSTTRAFPNKAWLYFQWLSQAISGCLLWQWFFKQQQTDGDFQNSHRC